MKQGKYFDDIEAAMKPGVITINGFLGNDTRKLSEIIEADNALVCKLGLSHEKIADRMKEFIEAGKKGLGLSEVAYKGYFTINIDVAMGKLPCPFLHPGRFPKLIATITNNRIHRRIQFSELSVHMIREHGFYGGIGSLYRCEPKTIAEVLELQPEI